MTLCEMPVGSSVGRADSKATEHRTNKLREGRKFWTDETETASAKMRIRKERGERRGGKRPSNPHFLGSKICLALAVVSTVDPSRCRK